MEAADTCEIARLPEELISAALSLTSPLDACRAAAVSRDLRAAADSDATWSRFVPHDLMSMCLDRETGAKCYMLSVRALRILGGDTPQYWDWIPLPDSCRFSEVAQPRFVWELDICGSTTTRKVCLQSYIDEDEDRADTRKLCSRRYHRACRAYLVFPRKRTDGWMELKLGEFHIQNRDTAGEICMNLVESKGRTWKTGLLIQGIDVRPKRDLVVGSFAHPLLSTNLACTQLKHPKGHTINPNNSLSKFKQVATTSTVACEIVRLLQELLMKVLSYITPQDADRVAAVLQAFRAIVDSDTLWSRFVPDVYEPRLAYVSNMDHFIQQSVSKKEMFLCLSDQPILLAYHRMSMWLDRQTGSKCYMLTARELNIARVNKRKHWRWIRLTHCSFSEAAELQSVSWPAISPSEKG